MESQRASRDEAGAKVAASSLDRFGPPEPSAERQISSDLLLLLSLRCKSSKSVRHWCFFFGNTVHEPADQPNKPPRCDALQRRLLSAKADYPLPALLAISPWSSSESTVITDSFIERPDLQLST